jgi:hypothetical protein
MTYNILPYSLKQANKLGVDIKASTNPKKKIDVFKDDKKIASIGDPNYLDYPSYLKQKGKEVANERRRLYKARHGSNASKKGTPAYYANKILW